MRRVRMPEKQATWKSEGGLNRIEVIPERYEEALGCLHADHVPETFYTRIF